MNTVCPSYQCPPTMPSAPPHTQPSLAASVSLLQSSTCRTSAKALFSYVSDRLRSSGIVSDRLGSSEPTASHRPAIPAELPKCSFDSARQAGKLARQNASFRVKLRTQTPVREKMPFRGIRESFSFPTTGQQESATTACPRSALTLVRVTIGAKTAAQAAAVNRVVHKNQMNWSSDKCQRALNTIQHPLSTAVTRSIPAPKEGCLPISLPSTRHKSANFLQNPARHPDLRYSGMRYTGSNQPENAMAALIQRRRIEMYACPSYPSNTHRFDHAQPAPAATTRHLARLYIKRPRPPKGPARHTLSPLSRPGNFAAVAPMLPTDQSSLTNSRQKSHQSRPEGDQCRQKTVKRRPMSHPNVDPSPATLNILSRAAAQISCHEEEEKFPRNWGHWETLVDFDTLSIPSHSRRAASRAPAPGAASAPARTHAPRRRPPRAGTVNLKSPQLQKPHLPSTLVRKCARSKSRTGRSRIDARRIDYIFRQQTPAMGTRECEQSARRVNSITQLAVARPGKEASRMERPGPPERRPHCYPGIAALKGPHTTIEVQKKSDPPDLAGLERTKVAKRTVLQFHITLCDTTRP